MLTLSTPAPPSKQAPFPFCSNYLKNAEVHFLGSWARNANFGQEGPSECATYPGQRKTSLFLTGVSSLMTHEA